MKAAATEAVIDGAAVPDITDHALLRWMERAHGIDVEGWRSLMRGEVEEALSSYTGRYFPGQAAFVVTKGYVVTYLGDGQVPIRAFPGSVYVPRQG